MRQMSALGRDVVASASASTKEELASANAHIKEEGAVAPQLAEVRTENTGVHCFSLAGPLDLDGDDGGVTRGENGAVGIRASGHGSDATSSMVATTLEFGTPGGASTSVGVAELTASTADLASCAGSSVVSISKFPSRFPPPPPPPPRLCPHLRKYANG